eukprot:scaffold580264_cov22-Prasinocladus_malaysianus.AAC.1
MSVAHKVVPGMLEASAIHIAAIAAHLLASATGVYDSDRGHGDLPLFAPGCRCHPPFSAIPSVLSRCWGLRGCRWCKLCPGRTVDSVDAHSNSL